MIEQHPRLISAFWLRVERNGDDDCWPWRGTKSPLGYGVIRVYPDGRLIRAAAHRLAYELRFGPIPVGLVLDHLCRNPPCVNPAHLEPVTSAENSRRGYGPPAQNARKVNCQNGHPLTGPNLRVTRRGERRCRTCDRAGAAVRRSRTAVGRYRTVEVSRPASATHPQDHVYGRLPHGKVYCKTCNRARAQAYAETHRTQRLQRLRDGYRRSRGTHACLCYAVAVLRASVL